MLYKITQDKTIFENNPELQAIPQFAKLDDRSMTIAALVADKRSPLRTLPEKQRREKACMIVECPMEDKRLAKNWRDFVNGTGSKSLEEAIKVYKEYQHDPNLETYETLVKQISEIRDFINSDKTVPSTNSKGEQLKDDKGNYIRTMDASLLKLAITSAEKLPVLEEARQKLEVLLNINKEEKVELKTYTAADISDEVDGDSELSTLDKFMSNQK